VGTATAVTWESTEGCYSFGSCGNMVCKCGMDSTAARYHMVAGVF